MSYLATLTFDLEDATTEDYEAATDELAKLGFSKIIVGSSGKEISLPENTYVGEFEGASVGKVRDDLSDSVRSTMVALRLKAKIYVSVGGNWAWGARST